MKIGICASPNKIALAEKLGYDYIETNFSWLASLDDVVYREQDALVERSSLNVEAYNIFFRGDMKLYALDGNQDPLLRKIFEYAKAGFARAAAWGGKIAVIGSGFVRGIPEGMTREAADQQFARVLNVCGEAADRYGMKIVVEPLSFCDCNYIHTVSEASAVAQLSGHPAVGVLVDFFHHNNVSDDLNALPSFADSLYHVHYARNVDRFVPCEEDVPTLKALAQLLRQCPKAERISLECVWKPDFDTAITQARPFMEIFKGV